MPSDSAADWPGKRIGLPAEGSRSVARIGRRIAALCLDWAACYAIAWAFLPRRDGTADAVWILAVFASVQIISLILLNGSPGHLVLGMRLVPTEPKALGVWRPVVRTVLLCLVIPAVIWDRDQRGLHDVIAGTILVRN